VAVRAILEYPDPRLRLHAAPVAAFDAGLARLVEDLLDTLRAAGGIGLSAPQLGVASQVAVADLAGDGTAPQVYVNPALLARSRLGIVEESCLSVPGIVGNVIRATRVRIRAQDASGAGFERDLEGLAAVCLQHELDHLAGRLFIDRLSPLRRLMLRARAARRSAAG
jgi:peptide deformylase